MKRFTFFCLVTTVAGSLWAADGPCDVKRSRTGGWAKEQLSEFAEHISIYNDHNSYGLDYIQWKPGAMQTLAPRAQLWLFEPRMYGGFSRPIFNFIQLTVNGISNNRLHPGKEDVVLWQNGGYAGCRIKMNFDGAKIVSTWYLRPDSPVLWCSLRPAANVLEPIRELTVRFQAIPSGHAKDENGKVIWSGVYQPQTISPVRTIEQSENPIPLTAEDAYLIFQDAKFDDIHGGPCYLTLDYASVLNTQLVMKNAADRTVTFELKPDFREFRFGLWQQKDALSNAAFMEKFKKENPRFLLNPVAPHAGL